MLSKKKDMIQHQRQEHRLNQTIEDLFRVGKGQLERQRQHIDGKHHGPNGNAEKLIGNQWRDVHAAGRRVETNHQSHAGSGKSTCQNSA